MYLLLEDYTVIKLWIYLFLFLMSASCLFDLTLLLFLKLVIYSPLPSTCTLSKEPVQAPVLSEPRPPRERGCHRWLAGWLGAKLQPPLFPAKVCLSGCGNWWLDNAMYAPWELNDSRQSSLVFSGFVFVFWCSLLRMCVTLSWSHALNSFISSNISTFYKSPVSLISFLLPARG